MQPILARVKTGINTDTLEPFFYVEARLTPKRPWSYLTDGKKWITHRSRPAAEREATKLHKRLCAKMILLKGGKS